MNSLAQSFIKLLLEQGALKFGSFTLKSGRQSPYFFNLGAFNNGASLAKLGHFYAQTICTAKINCDMLFGPAYKGIPLVSTTAIALAQEFNQDLPYCFNRKLKKTYGDAGDLVGAPLQGDVIMVDDVITAGTTAHETITLMKAHNANLAGIVIAFDRQEKSDGSTCSATQAVADQYGIPIFSIITLNDLIEYLQQQQSLQSELTEIANYQAEYGV